MAAKTKNEPPGETNNLFDELIKGVHGVNRKGATMPYTSINGNMFSFIDKTGLFSLRLSEEDREAFIKKYKTGLSLQYGVVMKEYVSVPDKLFRNTSELKPWFEKSYAYAQTLKAKPTKKK